MIYFICRPLESELDVMSAIDALKKCNPEEDSPHVRRLLSETFTARRSALKSESVTAIKDVVNMYPQLKMFSLVCYSLISTFPRFISTNRQFSKRRWQLSLIVSIRHSYTIHAHCLFLKDHTN